MTSAAAPRRSLWQRLRVETLVTIACVATLLALALMSWSVLDPTPLPVMVAMSLGQAVGTLALGCYLLAVLLYQVRRSGRSLPPPPPKESTPPDPEH